MAVSCNIAAVVAVVNNARLPSHDSRVILLKLCRKRMSLEVSARR